ncbi:hypothetical protein ACHAXR_009096 [Thalassiosira sp. AJA248-18]
MRVHASMAAAGAASVCCATHAFQSHVHYHAAPSSKSSRVVASPLFAKKKKNGGSGGKGFGANNPNKEPKYSINDKSYGDSPMTSPEQTPEEAQSFMTDFFTTYSDWKPLFRNIMCSSSTPLATPFLSDTHSADEVFGIPTLENRNPWRLLPPKPTSDSSLQTLSTFLDEWQQSLLDIPLDALITGDNDKHFLEEGRRTIAVTRFHVLDESSSSGSSIGQEENYDWKMELFRTCWSEMAHLMTQDEYDTGSLVLLPDHLVEGEERGLDYVREFVESNLIRPIQWLGRHEDLEITAMERGSLAVRLLYKLSDIPDLNDRDSGGDEDVKLL